MAKPKVSIIIRTRNEERWIGASLSGVFSQSYTDFEVILVDNESTDHTVRKACSFPIAKVLTCRDYTPGKALNIGIQASRGERIVCLSGHCIPVTDRWLENLVRNLDEDGIVGVYGRQEPLASTSDADRRDLAIAFGLDRKVQVKDSFFHNANSAVRRESWELLPFDETLSNIEDRAWAQEVLKQGHRIVYDPDASVYHHHGIHQGGNADRCASVVRILERLSEEESSARPPPHMDQLNVVAIIPVRGPVQYLNSTALLAYTIERAKQIQCLKGVIVSTDDTAVARLAEREGAEAPFLRPPELSRDFVDLEQVLTYTLAEIEDRGIHPDIVLSLEATFPFRPVTMLDDMIVQLVQTGVDSILVGKRESQSIWKQEGARFDRVDEGYVPRKYKEPIFVGYKGLGCATHASIIREGHLLGDRLAIYELDRVEPFIEVRTQEDFTLAAKLIDSWCDEQRRLIEPCQQK